MTVLSKERWTMSRKARGAGSRHATPAPLQEKRNGWTVAIVFAIALAAALAWMTTATANSSRQAQALPMAAKTPRVGLADAGQRIAIDPATGQTRPIELDDAALPQAAAAADPDVEQFALPGGGVGAKVPDTADVYTVATKAQDGTVAIGHAVGKPDADRMMGTLDKARSNGAKEGLNDR
jgi:hypothetical protein